MTHDRRTGHVGSAKALGLALVVLLLLFFGSAAAFAAGPAAPAVVFHGSGFNPMVSNIVTGTKLTFVNRSASPLQLVSAPGSALKVRESIAGGRKAVVGFTKPGVYLLYDASTTAFGTTKISGVGVDQVIAKPDSPYFPLPGYAVIAVLNPDGGGIAETKPEVVIPDTSMVFVPWVTVVRAGTPILFRNADSDAHVVAPGPDAMMMHENGVAASPEHTKYDLQTMQAYKPLVLPGGGGSATLTLNKPGVYHYYCSIHAFFSAENSTYAPQKSFGGYPYVQDGLIVVLPGKGAA
jgi:plastocyanin